MALTSQQQYDVVILLGHPGKTLLYSSTHYNSIISARVNNLVPEIESHIIELVRRVKCIDERLEMSLGRMSTLEVQDIKLDPAEQTRLRKERRILLAELSDLTDIEIAKSGGVNIQTIA